MAEEMLFLANQGVEVLRLDAVAFIWKRLGTNCENQPEAHTLIRAFNAMAKICAPAMIFKSEAIVHPDDVMSYVHPDECRLSYNPHLFAYIRSNGGQRLLVVNNFSEFEQTMPGDRLAAAGLTADAHRIYFDETLPVGDALVLDGYQFAWINIC